MEQIKVGDWVYIQPDTILQDQWGSPYNYSHIIGYVPEADDDELNGGWAFNCYYEGNIPRFQVRVRVNMNCVNNGEFNNGYGSLLITGPDDPNGCRQDYEMLTDYIDIGSITKMELRFQRFANDLEEGTHGASFWVQWFDCGKGVQALINEGIYSVNDLVKQYIKMEHNNFINQLVNYHIAGVHNAGLIAEQCGLIAEQYARAFVQVGGSQTPGGFAGGGSAGGRGPAGVFWGTTFPNQGGNMGAAPPSSSASSDGLFGASPPASHAANLPDSMKADLKGVEDSFRNRTKTDWRLWC